MGKLTARQVKTIRCAGMHNDGHGLYLQITPPDGRSWILRTRIHGKPRYIGLGSAHLVTLAEAREEAQRLRKIARSGGDPLVERSKATITFAEAAQKTFEAKREGWKNGKHTDNWIATLHNHVFPTIGDRPIETLRSADVLTVLAPIWHSKAETARRVRQRIASVFQWAKAAGFYSHENPTISVTEEALGAQTDRVKHFESMPWSELPGFMQELGQRTAITSKALAFGILCASRSGEVRGARWAEIDLEARIWTIPPERMKGRKGKEVEHRVPLSDAAISMLKTVEGGGSAVVFPVTQRAKDGSERELSDNAFRALLKRMGKEGVTAHGFRSSFRVWAQESHRAEHDVVEKCLAHAVGNKVSQSYARSDLLEQRRPVMEAWARFILPGANSTADIVQLHG
ncbi:site-specific integrase [Shimia thalassica]|uniref:tyrosine-type recombinase/integrase n=1 Tax=Shimia thalassica TaxID=1715693 RepID=UPI001C095452|nr:site-specific integrase [Shimia thalassica]MBU2942939.1 site-specific integrase [Shimia thalassica]MDO6502738.1 site-specific integrase [Shimia thalassica]